jgi:hypothetical protein
VALPLIRRADFNQSVVHLTRERKIMTVPGDATESAKTERSIHAFHVLKEILITGVIKGSGNEGFIKGNQKAVCFSEIPLSVVHEFASPPDRENARYRFYGIALSKRTIFAAGGRPVIYLPDAEATWIPADQKWRHVRYEFGEVDFTHEREWRVRGDFELTKVPGLYVLVWSAEEALELNQFRSPLEKLIRGILPMEHITTML